MSKKTVKALVEALEIMKRSLKSNIHNYQQETGHVGGAIDQDDYDAWESELKIVNKALSQHRRKK